MKYLIYQDNSLLGYINNKELALKTIRDIAEELVRREKLNPEYRNKNFYIDNIFGNKTTVSVEYFTFYFFRNFVRLHTIRWEGVPEYQKDF